ncbi:MAG: hypothetical protein R2795_11695 [Saprospiraceae bacterium]
MRNFALLDSIVTASGAAFFITTTQPRKFGQAGQIALQETMRDSIICIYSGRSIDF